MKDRNPNHSREAERATANDGRATRVSSRPTGLDPDDVEESVDVDEELRKQARFEAIHTARSEAGEQIKNARELQVKAKADLDSVDADRFVAGRIYDGVLRYVLELEPYLTSLPSGRHYWEEMPLGTVEFRELEVRDEAAGYGRGTDDVETRHPDAVRLVGLCDFVESGGRFERALEALGEVDRVVRPVPPSVSVRAFRAANQFASDVGLDVEPESGTTDAAFDASDL